MKAIKILTLSAVALTLLAGCASSGPNTRRAAAGGAVAGAVLGGIVGHQSGEGLAGAAVGAAAGGAAGAALGNKADRDRGTTDVSAADRGYVVVEPPPTPTSQPNEPIPPRPAPQAVWIAGHWAYTGNQSNPYEWMAGHWEIPPPGRTSWMPGGWQRSGNGYVYVRGQWQ